MPGFRESIFGSARSRIQAFVRTERPDKAKQQIAIETEILCQLLVGGSPPVKFSTAGASQQLHHRGWF